MNKFRSSKKYQEQSMRYFRDKKMPQKKSNNFAGDIVKNVRRMRENEYTYLYNCFFSALDSKLYEARKKPIQARWDARKESRAIMKELKNIDVLNAPDTKKTRRM